MGTPKKPEPVLYFASLIFADEKTAFSAEKELERIFGAILEKSPPVPFQHSDYYAGEMGQDLFRFFLLFAPLSEREELATAKLATNGIEGRLGNEGKRRVNIDPGYLALEHVILATTKGFSHRVYLGRGIFADLTLMYRNGSYKPLEWTYPDYGSSPMITMFNGWRELYKRTLKGMKLGETQV
jgi:hypothetical protein